MIGAGSNWKRSGSPASSSSAASASYGPSGKSLRARHADEMWGSAAASFAGSSNGGGGGGGGGSSIHRSSPMPMAVGSASSQRGGVAIAPQNGARQGEAASRRFELPPSPERRGGNASSDNGYGYGAGEIGHPPSMLSGGGVGPYQQLKRSSPQREAAAAFDAYHNFHLNGGGGAIDAAMREGRALAAVGARGGGVRRGGQAPASPADRQRVLEGEHYPIRHRGQALHIMEQLRDPPTNGPTNGAVSSHRGGGGGGHLHHSDHSSGPPPQSTARGAAHYMTSHIRRQTGGDDPYAASNNGIGGGGALTGPSAYTYTGGFASPVFSTAAAEGVFEEGRREAHRQRHRQAYAALASVKPFLQRIFEDDDAAATLSVPQPPVDAAAAAPFGGDATAAAALLEEEAARRQQQSRSRALYGGSSYSSSSSALGGGGGAGHHHGGVAYVAQQQQQPTSAAAQLPAWDYESLVRREAAKPLLLSTVVTTDRCPLTTKTCPPTYTAFDTTAFAAEARDPEAYAYFGRAAATGSGAAAQARQRARLNGGGSETDPAMRLLRGFAFSAESSGSGAAGAGVSDSADTATTVQHGALQAGSLNVGLRVFRDFMLPAPPPASVSTAGKGTHNQLHDEAALLKAAHLAHLQWAIHSTKRVSERNHLAGAMDYDRW